MTSSSAGLTGANGVGEEGLRKGCLFTMPEEEDYFPPFPSVWRSSIEEVGITEESFVRTKLEG